MDEACDTKEHGNCTKLTRVCVVAHSTVDSTDLLSSHVV